MDHHYWISYQFNDRRGPGFGAMEFVSRNPLRPDNMINVVDEIRAGKGMDFTVIVLAISKFES
jgi:hypothetical protein